MMATTHAMVGLALATVLLFVAPQFLPVAIAAAIAGGIFPDLDLYLEHRKTFHFPVYYSVAAALALSVAALAPSTLTVGLAFFLLAAAVHSLMDIFGGGLELKPWEGRSERAVYDHYHARWIRPRRWVRYDGAPGDLALATVFGGPVMLLHQGAPQEFVAVALGVSLVYTLLRKRLVVIAEWLVAQLPAHVVEHVPERFLEDVAH